MKKSFKLQNLDCANCAAKMESGIKKIEGVQEASVSFLTQKLTLDAEDTRFEEIVAQAEKLCKRIEPDCVLKH
jgi:copper chaperone CopZ